MIGRKFGKLTVVSKYPTQGDRITRYLCRCDCGTEKPVMQANLTNQRRGTRSCGCSRSEARIDGLSHKFPREYQIWKHMLARCEDPRNKSFPNYGGRGIAVCGRWKTSFVDFLADMGERPTPLHTLDRRDANLNYEHSNCRWATMKEQQNNRTNNRILIFNDDALTLSQWSDRTGISTQTIRNRIRSGWSVADALTIPNRTKKWRGTPIP